MRRAGPWGVVASLGFIFGALVLSRAVQFGLESGVTAVRALGGGAAVDAVWFQTGSGFFWALSLFVCGAAELGCVALAIRFRSGPSLGDYLAWNRVSARVMAGWMVTGLLFAAGADALTWTLGRPIVPAVVLEAYGTAGYEPFLWLALVVAAPFTEEVVYRGFLFRGLEVSAVGPVGAIGATAVVWAATHSAYDGFSLGVVLAAGVLLGVARWRTGSLVVPLVLHMLLNVIATAEAWWCSQG